MSEQGSTMSRVKERAKHELREFAWVFAYLAVYSCMLATYSLLLRERGELEMKVFTYGTALFNAFVLAKVILLGEIAHLAKQSEDKPVIVTAVWKAFVFGLLAGALHIAEELVRTLVRGESVALMFHGLRIEDIVLRSLIIMAGLVPFFAFWELRRVLGEDKFEHLFFQPREKAA